MRLRLSFAVLGLAGALELMAQQPPPGQRPSFIRMHPLLSALDLDQDGEISAAERENAPAALAKLDADKDGSVRPEELRPQFGGGRPGGPGGGPGEAQAPSSSELVKTLLSFDSNGDGQLQKQEVPERMQGLFARADADQNGVLTSAELTKLAESQSGGPQAGGGEGRRGPGGPGGGGMRMDPILTALDADKNGTVSGAEITGSAAALRALDKNGDGKITEDEVRPQGGPDGRRGEGRR